MLADKVVLITGGSKGIGYGVAEVLLKESCRVAVSSRTKEGAQKAEEILNEQYPGKVLGLVSDVRDLEAQENAVEKVIEKWGKLDALVANAGLGHYNNIMDLTPEEWNETIDVNLTGVFYSVKACLPALRKSKGYIITMASLAGCNFFAKGSAYNASKFGLVGFTQAIMLDLRYEGIKVSTIMPGSVSSHFNGRNPEEGKDWRIQPEDLGQIVADLMKMNPRTLPSKVEVRPSIPLKK